MTESERFVPIIDPYRWNSCGECVQVCPNGVLELTGRLAVLVAPDRCAYCANCEAHCAQRAIGLPYEIVSDASA
jgi:NAD-dependent dihydropyrimidine dehydrogenase PreA subunit